MSGHTITAYRRDLLSLAEFGGRRKLTAWNSFDNAQLRTFAAALHGAGLSPRSIQAPKPKKRLPATLDADQMGRLLAFRVDDSLSARDKAIMELFYSSGLRLAELVSLSLASVDLADRTVRVLGKGSKTRIVPIGRKGIDALKVWLKERAGMVKSDVDALFVGQSGRPLSARAVQLRVGAWGRRQALNVHVHPHMFQELLGHANIGTTQIYTHLDFQHLATVYDNAHPRARRRHRSA